MADLRAFVNHTPGVAGDGTVAGVRQTNVGQLFTADWKEELVLEGRVFTAHVGSLTAGADVGLITGGGAGTTIDSDQPEVIVGVAAGTTLIPIEIVVNVDSDMDADADQMAVLIFADLTQAPPGTATATAPTVSNFLDAGGVTSVATIHTAVTADITDPVMTQLIDYKRVSVRDNGVAASAHLNGLYLDHKPVVPFLMDGPCSLVVCWGGTVATPGMARVTWAEVPTGRYDVIS